jgi:hypothetical protein
MKNEINIGVIKHSSVAQLVEQLTVKPSLFSSGSFINYNYERLSPVILFSKIKYKNNCQGFFFTVIHYLVNGETTSASYFRVVYHCELI